MRCCSNLLNGSAHGLLGIDFESADKIRARLVSKKFESAVLTVWGCLTSGSGHGNRSVFGMPRRLVDGIDFNTECQGGTYPNYLESLVMVPDAGNPAQFVSQTPPVSANPLNNL